MRLSQDPTIDTVAKLGAVSVAMFAFVFVVMVPLYNVLCDALGINGKTSSEAYISVSAEVDVYCHQQRRYAMGLFARGHGNARASRRC